MTFTNPNAGISTKEWMEKNIESNKYTMIDIPVRSKSNKEIAKQNKQNKKRKKLFKKSIGKTKGNYKIICPINRFQSEVVTMIIFDEVSDMEAFKNTI